MPSSPPPMAPLPVITAQSGYGGAARAAQLRTRASARHAPGTHTPPPTPKMPNIPSTPAAAHARNVAGNTPGMGGYGGAASVAIRNSPLAQQVRGQQRPLRRAQVHGARTQSALNKATQNKPIAAAAPTARKMSPKTRTGLMIGGAAAVGVALNNRSGRPADRGRQSTYRY
jgi:hypothetical protein